MRLRRILLSLVMMTGAIGAVVRGATFAPFTDSGEGGGAVRAGTVNVILNEDTDDEVVLQYTGPFCDNLAWGESCDASLTVRNAGSLSVTYLVLVGDDNPDCFTSTLSGLPSGDAEPDDSHADHDPGDSHTATLTTVLDGDQESCQGAQNEAAVFIRARQSNSPHN